MFQTITAARGYPVVTTTYLPLGYPPSAGDMSLNGRYVAHGWLGFIPSAVPLTCEARGGWTTTVLIGMPGFLRIG